MTISILVEPSSLGFVAATGGPLDLTAESASASEAIDALREKIAGRLRNVAFLIDHPVDTPPSPIPVLPLAENPLFDDWLAAVENFHTECDNCETFIASDSE